MGRESGILEWVGSIPETVYKIYPLSLSLSLSLLCFFFFFFSFSYQKAAKRLISIPRSTSTAQRHEYTKDIVSQHGGAKNLTIL